MSNTTVGVESGTTYINDLKTHFKDVKLLMRSKFSELLDALHEGKCQAIVTGYSEAHELQSINPNLKIIPIEETVISFSIALPKGSSLLEPINEKIRDMIKNGDIHKLETQFFKKIIKE
jgi:ABC-type amino acid transport substrate-binding protein